MSNELTKEAWIEAAREILSSYMGDQATEYAGSLYQTFVVEDGTGWTPADAVREDMSYWEAE